MFSDFLQFLFSGITVGSMYALGALGYALIYNASGVINFAQGEFVMLGAMSAANLMLAGLSEPLAILVAVLVAVLAGLATEKFAIEPAKDSPIITLIVITLGVGSVIRGLVQVFLGKDNHVLPAFSGEKPILLAGATLSPQTLWVIGVTLVVVLILAWFFGKTTLGKATVATHHNKLAAQLVGINTHFILLLSFAFSAMLGAIGGIIVTPITCTNYDSGLLLGLKGFAAAAIGGIGSGPGAIVGGLFLGVIEAMTAGYISSAYKDVVAFILMLLIFFLIPHGLLGSKGPEVL